MEFYLKQIFINQFIHMFPVSKSRLYKVYKILKVITLFPLKAKHCTLRLAFAGHLDELPLPLIMYRRQRPVKTCQQSLFAIAFLK